MNDKIISEKMYKWATDLFPICRSITGPGLRKTLKYIQNIIPELKIESISTGTKAFDWVVPDEWTIRDAFIKDDFGKKQHEELSDFCDSIDKKGAYFMLSNSDTVLTDEIYMRKGRFSKSFLVSRTIASNAKKRAKAEEVIITNYKRK